MVPTTISTLGDIGRPDQFLRGNTSSPASAVPFASTSCATDISQATVFVISFLRTLSYYGKIDDLFQHVRFRTE